MSKRICTTLVACAVRGGARGCLHSVAWQGSSGKDGCIDPAVRSMPTAIGGDWALRLATAANVRRCALRQARTARVKADGLGPKRSPGRNELVKGTSTELAITRSCATLWGNRIVAGVALAGVLSAAHHGVPFGRVPRRGL